MNSINQLKNKDFNSMISLNRPHVVGVHELVIRTPKQVFVVQYDNTGDKDIIAFTDKLSEVYKDKVVICHRMFNNRYTKYVRLLTFDKLKLKTGITRALLDAPEISAGIMLGFSFERYVIAKAVADELFGETRKRYEADKEKGRVVFDNTFIDLMITDRLYDEKALSKLARALNVEPSVLRHTQGEPSTYLKNKIDDLARKTTYYSRIKELYDYMKNLDKE